jgi:general secretion pathway protein I
MKQARSTASRAGSSRAGSSRAGSPRAGSPRAGSPRAGLGNDPLRGFTLLEVMVALAILGLGLTVILSSQTGLLAAVGRVRGETYAQNLLRCRMTEIELDLSMQGFSLLDETESGECCEDEDEPGYTCEWKIESVELPDPSSVEEQLSEASTGDDLGATADGEVSESSGTGPTGVFGALSTIEQSDGAALGEGSGLSDLGGMLEDTSGGPDGMITMALSLVYPTLKPMLEASIRRVSVSVKWKEGQKERDLSAVQYLTSPLEGSLNPNAAEGLEDVGVTGSESEGDE